MFDGKMKAVTFSYDDGVTQDIRLVELFNKYGLKGTFNLNSEKLGLKGRHDYTTSDGVLVKRDMVGRSTVKELYCGHEVAVHTLTHPLLPTLSEEDIVHQVEQDRINLSEICGYEVVGMAYPGGGVNNDDRVADIIRRKTGVKYARTTTSTGNFDIQTELLRFDPTVYHRRFDTMFQLAEKFIEMRPDSPKLFYIWGHSYEFDEADTWDRFEEFLRLISGHDDIFYGTNSEVLL